MSALVAVLGDSLLDVVATPSEPMRLGGDVPAAIRLQAGGQGANVAVRLARRGISVRLVSSVGEDAAGRLIRETLLADGVELRDAGVARTAPAVIVLVDPTGERTMLSQRPPLLGQAFDVSAIADANWLLVSGYVLLEPSAVFSFTGPSPRRVILGCSLSPAQSSAWFAAAGSLAPHLVVLNLDEARTLAPGTSEVVDLSRLIGERLRAIAVVTHPGGAAAEIDGHPVEVTHPASSRAVDTTGAGDAFAAALVADLLDGAWPPAVELMRHAMTAAVDVATAVTGVVGAQTRVVGEP